MKRIPPAIQENQRYLKFKVRGEDKELGEIVEAVWSSATKFMGVKEASKADIWIIGGRFDEKNQEGIIRVHRDNEDSLRAALALNSSFNDDTIFTVENISGTVSGGE